MGIFPEWDVWYKAVDTQRMEFGVELQPHTFGGVCIDGVTLSALACAKTELKIFLMSVIEQTVLCIHHCQHPSAQSGLKC